MATEEVSVKGRREPGALKNFVAGGVGGVCVVLVGHPLDTIKVGRRVGQRTTTTVTYQQYSVCVAH